MRERITFIHGPDAEFNSEQLEVRKDFVRVRDLDAAREDRLTFSFQELPPEVCWFALLVSKHAKGRLSRNFQIVSSV